MRRLTASERRNVTLRVDRSLRPRRTGLAGSLAVTIGNKTNIALRSAPPYPVHIVAQWEPADMRRGEMAWTWTWHPPAKVPANSEARFQFEIRPPRSGRLRLRLKLVQPNPLAPDRPTLLAEAATTLVALPASLPASIARFCRRAGGLAAVWDMFI